MIRATCFALACLAPQGLPAVAQTASLTSNSGYSVEAPDLFHMFEVMGLYEILGIMAVENARGADSLEASMFPGQGGAAWQARVSHMHTPERLIRLFEEHFPTGSLSRAQIATITTFMESDRGRRLISGEIAARRAFLDEDAVTRGTAALMEAMEAEDARLETLITFNEVNDLIDRNVSGALNARFAFFRGMVDGGAFADEMPEDMMIADVWSQEPELRQSTVEWLFSFQFTAYSNVENEDLQAYVTLSQTDAGQALNAALFVAFDALIGELSYEMGVAAAEFIAGEDI